MHLVLLLGVIYAQPQPLTITWDCLGEPPPAPLEAVLSEPVVLDAEAAPNASQRAMEQARHNLQARLCQGTPCPQLAQAITPWVYGKNERSVCAIASINKQLVEDFKRQLHNQRIRHELDKSLVKLLNRRQDRGRRLIVAVDKVTDGGAAGGPRAEWLISQILSQLSDWKGVTIVKPPHGWSGKRLPRGTNVVLQASMVPLQDNLTPGVGVALEARRNSGRKVALVRGDSFWIREDIMPTPHSSRTEPATSLMALPTLDSSDASLSIRIDAPPPGTLCAGEVTSLRLWSEKRRYVRVFNLFANGRAILVFPNEYTQGEGRSGLIKADEEFLVPPGKFQANPLMGEREGFLVVAADREEALGEFQRGFDSRCRLSESQARKVWSPTSLPRSLSRAMTSYRIVQGGECQSIDAPSPEQVEALLAELPECGRTLTSLDVP